MAEHKVVFLAPALDDLEEIVLYIAKGSAGAALKIHDAIIAQSAKLAIFPKLGRLVPDRKLGERGFRILKISPYILLYRMVDETIFIYRVFHGARYYPVLFKTLSE